MLEEFYSLNWVGSDCVSELALWARHEVRLYRAPSRRTIQYVVNNDATLNIDGGTENRKKASRNRSLKSPEIERILSEWIWGM